MWALWVGAEPGWRAEGGGGHSPGPLPDGRDKPPSPDCVDPSRFMSCLSWHQPWLHQGQQVVPLETAIRGFSSHFPGHPPAGHRPPPATARPQGQALWKARPGRPGPVPAPRPSLPSARVRTDPRCTWLVPQGRPLRKVSGWGPPVGADVEGDSELGTDGAPVPLLWAAGPPGTRDGKTHKPGGSFLAEEAKSGSAGP